MNRLEEYAKIHEESKRIITTALLECSNPSLTRQDIEGNAVAILARLAKANLLLERVEVLEHTDKLVAIATNVVRKSHRNDLYFIDCLRVDAASSLRLALVELSDYLREW